jgi:riboflavin kinase / FMN adenylyltransferase
VWITSSVDTVKTPTYVALGNFDGVHRGHRQVIQPILTDASTQASRSIAPGEGDADSASESQRPHVTVVTFHPHPQEFFTGQRRLLLTPLEEKEQYLQSIGVEQLVLLTFNQALAALTPEEFVEIVLVRQLQAKRISVGQDFCFGRQRSGTATDLQTIAARYNIPVEIAPLHTCQGDRISSSAIRHALDSGDLEQANELLGRSYTLVGEVVQGQQLGRTIGFPTANLKLPSEKYLPRQGVYSVRVRCSGSSRSEANSAAIAVAAIDPGEAVLPGVMNIGNRPTVNGTQQTIEVHLLDWSGDLYGQTLTVSLESFLRPEQKFASLDQLKAQIQDDCERARSLLACSQVV